MNNKENRIAYTTLYQNIHSYNPHFEEQQTRGAQIIAGIISKIDADSGGSDICHVLEVGSGTGEILRHIAQKCDRVKTCTGIDICEYAIQTSELYPVKYYHEESVAGEKQRVTTVNYEHGDFKDIINKKWIESNGINIQQTLILCVGHTAFHFDTEEFLEWLEEVGAPFLLVDWHSTWDDALCHINKTCTPFFEPIRCDTANDASFMLGLKTILDTINKGLVWRGVSAISSLDQSERWIYGPTCQVNMSSIALHGYLRERGYARINSAEYVTGFGRKRLSVFHRENSLGAEFNKSHYKVSCASFLPHLFSAVKFSPDTSYEFSGSIAHLLRNFDSVAVGVVLGYDPHLSFIKYVPIHSGSRDWFKEGSDIDEQCNDCPEEKSGRRCNMAETKLLLQPYAGDERDYLSADRLYYSLLANPGGSLLLSPSTIKNLKAKMSKCDIAFADNGQADYLKATARVLGVSRGKERNKSPYLVMPIYYGSFPIVVIVGRPALHAPRLGKGYWTAVAGQLSDFIKSKISEDVLRDYYIRPLMQEVRTKSSGEPSMISWKQIIKNVYVKPWKSWIEAFPEVELREISEVKNNQLLNMWEDECDRIRNDRWCISKKLEKIYFFGEAERNGDATTEGGVLSQKMTGDSEKDNSTDSVGNKHDPHEGFCGAHLVKLSMVLGASSQKIENFKAMSETLKSQNWIEVISFSAYRDFFFENLALGSTHENDNVAKDAFKNLKCVFCRNHKNTGTLFRFSILGLKNLIAIETGFDIKKIKLSGLEINPFDIVSNNPEPNILEFLKQWVSTKDLPVIECILIRMNKNSNDLTKNFLEQPERVIGDREYVISISLNFIKEVRPIAPGDGSGGISIKNLTDWLMGSTNVHIKIPAEGSKVCSISFVIFAQNDDRNEKGDVIKLRDCHCVR